MSRLDELIKELCPDGVEYKKLESILKIKNGSDYKSFGMGNIPVYGSGGIMTYIDRFAYDKPSVLIPRKGSIDKLYYVDTPFWNVDTIFYTEINPEIALPRYVYHCLLREHLEQYNTAGGVPNIIQRLLAFFERFFGLGPAKFTEEPVMEEVSEGLKVAEFGLEYNAHRQKE